MRGGPQRGSAELLLLFFTLSLQLIFWQASLRVAKAWTEAYSELEVYHDRLELSSPESVMAWGTSWSALPPRIDYGAYFERQHDAEALCYFQDFIAYEPTGTIWRCD